MDRAPKIVLSSLHSQAAWEYLTESLTAKHTIAPLPKVCAQLASLTAQQSVDAPQLARLIESDPALAGEVMRVANSPALRPRFPATRRFAPARDRLRCAQ